MRTLLLYLITLLPFIMLGCAMSGGSLPFDPADPPSDPNTFVLPGQFSQTQGEDGWSYYSCASGNDDYQPLTWGNTPPGSPAKASEGWLKNGVAPIIARTLLTPSATHDAVIAWRAPRGGDATISLVMKGTYSGGDGVKVSFWRNDDIIMSPATVAQGPSQSQTLSSMRAIEQNDTLYIRVSANQNAENDWFGYQLTITIQQ